MPRPKRHFFHGPGSIPRPEALRAAPVTCPKKKRLPAEPGNRTLVFRQLSWVCPCAVDCGVGFFTSQNGSQECSSCEDQVCARHYKRVKVRTCARACSCVFAHACACACTRVPTHTHTRVFVHLCVPVDARLKPCLRVLEDPSLYAQVSKPEFLSPSLGAGGPLPGHDRRNLVQAVPPKDQKEAGRVQIRLGMRVQP